MPPVTASSSSTGSSPSGVASVVSVSLGSVTLVAPFRSPQVKHRAGRVSCEAIRMGGYVSATGITLA
jgi:hypothetical protein